MSDALVKALKKAAFFNGINNRPAHGHAFNTGSLQRKVKIFMLGFFISHHKQIGINFYIKIGKRMFVFKGGKAKHKAGNLFVRAYKCMVDKSEVTTGLWKAAIN